MRWEALTNADRRVLGDAMAEVAKRRPTSNDISELQLILADTLDALAGQRRRPPSQRRRVLAARLRANSSPIGTVVYKVNEDVT